MSTMLKSIVEPRHRWLRSFGRTRTGFEDYVFHPDGERVIAADREGTVTVWNIEDGAELRRLPALLSAPEIDDARGVDLRLHPDGVQLFVTIVIVDTSDVTLCWNLDRGDLVETYDYPRVPWRFVGDRLAVTCHGLYLSFWDLVTSKDVRRLRRDDASWRLYGMIGEHALAGGRAGVEMWNLRDGRVWWSTVDTKAAGVAGELAVLASIGQLELRALDGTIVRAFGCPDLAEAADWRMHVDRGGTTAVIVGASPDLLAIDLATGMIRSRFEAPGPYVQVKIGASDRDAIVETIEHGAIVWELATGAHRMRASRTIALSPDGDHAVFTDGARLRLVAADGDHRATTAAGWRDITIGSSIIAIDRADAVHAVDRAGAVQTLWSLGTPHELVALEGDRVVLRDGNAIAVIDAVTGTRERTIALPWQPMSLAICADGHVVIACDKEGEIRTWNIVDDTTTRFRVRDRAPKILAVERDARRVAIRSGTTIELWRRTDPMRLHSFRSETEAQCAAFDPTCRWLVSGHFDGALVVRDAIARAHHATILAHTDPIRAIAIRDTRLIACADDGTVSLWNLETGESLARWTGDHEVADLAWIDDDTIACASSGGLVVLRHQR